MHASLNLLVPAAILAIAAALPANENLFARGGELVARGAILHPSCERTNTFKSKEKFSVKVNAALKDVNTLAKEATSNTVIKGDVTYRMSDAFTHYFADEQYDQVMEMMRVIANLDSYNFNILCGSDQDVKSCEQGSLGATNPDPDKPNIVLCDKFFKPNENEVKNELSFRDDSDTRRGWCQRDADDNAANKFPFFAVSGLTLFHELTHLDLIGTAAKLKERNKLHGTEDIYELGGADNLKYYKRGKDLMQPYDAARQLKNLVTLHAENPIKNTYQPLLSQVENAESYAASALEWHFEILCKFSIESDWTGPPEPKT